MEEQKNVPITAEENNVSAIGDNNEPKSSLSDTMQSAVYGDEFEDVEPTPKKDPAPPSVGASEIEAPEQTIPPSEEQKAGLEGSTGYDDDFDDANYGDEFEEEERSASTGQDKNKVASDSTEKPVSMEDDKQAKAPVVGKDCSMMKRQMTAELESPSAPDTGTGNSYQDDFDHVGTNDVSLAESSKFGAEEELRSDVTEKPKVSVQEKFDIELVEENDGGEEGEKHTIEDSKESLKLAIQNASLNMNGEDDEYGDDDFDL